MSNNLYKRWDECKEGAKSLSIEGDSGGICYSPFALTAFGALYISVDGTGSESLYVQLDEETTASFSGPDIAGMLFSVNKFPKLDISKNFLKISLDSQSSLPEAFEAFCVTVARTISTIDEPSEALDTIFNIIDKYQSFFGKGAKRRLSPFEEQGLFGELLILEKVLSMYGDNAINTWTGPDKNKHDFIFSNNDSIEIKTSLKQTRIRIKISNENQLSYDPKSKLFLKVLTLEINPSGQTVLDLINRLLKDGLKSEMAKNMFKMKLLEMGIDYETVTVCHKYVLVGTHTYYVDSFFPRLTIEDVHGISNRIYDLKYTIDLDGFEEEKGNIYECLRLQ